MPTRNLLLDEPPANLDPINERAILNFPLGIPKNRPLLLITHRPIGLEALDKILVLDRGRIMDVVRMLNFWYGTAFTSACGIHRANCC